MLDGVIQGHPGLPAEPDTMGGLGKTGDCQGQRSVLGVEASSAQWSVVWLGLVQRADEKTCWGGGWGGSKGSIQEGTPSRAKTGQ